MTFRPHLPLTAVLLTFAAQACNPDDPRADAGSTGDSDATSAADSDDSPGSGDSPATGDSSDSGDSSGPLCGNGRVDPDEMCDGADLAGHDCSDLDPGFVGALLCAGDCQAVDASACGPAPSPDAPRVVLNEVTSKPPLVGPYADRGDAIELYNAGGATAQLGGWKLSDDPSFPADKTYVFATGTELAAGATLVLVEYDPMTASGDLPFGISSSGQDTITLLPPDGGPGDAVVIHGPDALESWCRLPDGTGDWRRCLQTLGGPNSVDGVFCGDGTRDDPETCDEGDLGGRGCADLGFTAGALVCSGACTLDASQCQSSSPIVISELESVNDGIELHNSGDVKIDLGGWILTDDPSDTGYDPLADLDKLVFLGKTSLAPGAFLVIEKGEGPGQHPFGLGSDGDTVTLYDDSLTPISRVTYGAEQAQVSYCRLPDGPDGTWRPNCAPSPGQGNAMP